MECNCLDCLAVRTRKKNRQAELEAYDAMIRDRDKWKSRYFKMRDAAECLRDAVSISTGYVDEKLWERGADILANA